MANVICITVYTMQLVVGLAVNSYSLVYLLRERMALHNKNRMILLLIHLTCADLFVSNLTLLSFFLCVAIFEISRNIDFYIEHLRSS